MMALTIVAYLGWFRKESMFIKGPASSTYYGEGSCVITGTIGYGCALVELALRPRSMSFFFHLNLSKLVVGDMKG